MQEKHASLRKSLSVEASKLNFADLERKRNRLTLLELDKLPESTTTYKAVGKMFIAVPYTRVVAECRSAVEGLCLIELTDWCTF